MLLRVEDSRSAVKRDASIWSFPLAVDESHVNLRLAVIALELNRLHKNLDARYSQSCSSQAYELVDEV